MSNIKKIPAFIASSSVDLHKMSHDFKGHYLDDRPKNRQDIFKDACEQNYSHKVCNIIHEELPDCVDIDTIDRQLQRCTEDNY